MQERNEHQWLKMKLLKLALHYRNLVYKLEKNVEQLFAPGEYMIYLS